MITLPGYQIVESLKTNSQTTIYRGKRLADGTPLIFKSLSGEYPSPSAIARLKHEYEILSRVNISGVVKAVGLKTYNNLPILILEDFGGTSLKDVIATIPLDLANFLPIAIQLAQTLTQLHQQHIIHKDIKPSNIIFNPDTKQLKLSDFSISSQLERENQTIGNLTSLEGTLAYMSPEQTGRMNRAIDYRTDFYSLGVTFYEILVGQLPFYGNDPIELVHCHIAKQPIPPQQLNPSIPQPIAEIVLKLLAKNAEDRYQSAFGLTADLETCLDQLETSNQVDIFPLGRLDKSGQFQIPQKLYGRSREVEILITTFERVSQGATEMMLIAGYSGIGKSALVNEIHKPIVRQRGYFISGKFDQFQRNIPYSSLIQAFQDLVRQLLAESEDQIQSWQTKLLASLGANGQAIVDVIPDVELIIGKQPPIPTLGPAESQNRFNLVFQKFVVVFAQKQHPLVLFLDDLQWADLASLQLIQHLVANAEEQSLLLIGAYRDNEVDTSHPLMLTLEEIRSSNATINTLTLQPLNITDINQLIADTLFCNLDCSKLLAELMLQKTNGNPFFLTQLLNSLYQDNFLTFDFSTGKWQWDINQISSVGITDNVVELMVNKIQKLSPTTQNVLKLAACIGNRFNFNILTIVNEHPPSRTAEQLWPALQASLILPLDNAYKIPIAYGQEADRVNFNNLTVSYTFLHDRVQQAAYSLIVDENKKEAHLKIGRLLLKNTDEETLEENIFDIVNQLNAGLELIDNLEEKTKLAKLNLLAGQKAKASTAYKTAAKHLNIGLEILLENSWETAYDLTFSLCRELAECEYLNGNFEKGKELFDIALQQGKSKFDKAEIYSIQMNLSMTQGDDFKAGINAGLDGLKILGLAIPKSQEVLKKLVEQEFQEIQIGLEKIDIPDLFNRPESKDRTQNAMMRLLVDLWALAYLDANPYLLSLTVLKIVNMSLENGNTSLSAFGYVTYGMTLAGYQNYQAAYDLGNLALRLNQKFHRTDLIGKVNNLFSHSINPYKKHLRTNLEFYKESYQTCMECGDLTYCVWAIFFILWTRFEIGEDLQSVSDTAEKYLSSVQQINDQNMLYSFLALQRIVWNLQDETNDRDTLSDALFEETLCLEIWHTNNFDHGLNWYAYLKAQLLYLYGNYHAAFKLCQKAEDKVATNVGFFPVTKYYFYYSLSLAAVYSTASAADREIYWQTLENNQAQMKIWADHCPENFLHKYLLVAAEMASLSGQREVAMDFYDRAIDLAREYQFVQDEALGNELAARFWLNYNKEKIARVYLREAHYGYQRWGAKRKVKDLEKKYELLLSNIAPERQSEQSITTNTTTSTSSSSAGTLDLTTVMKASQALAGEIVLDKLLKRLMRIVLENAGAQSGCLILDRKGQWMIVASGRVDAEIVTTPQSIAVEAADLATQPFPVPSAIINYVVRTQKNVVLNNAAYDGQFTRDPYIATAQPKSILCTPLLHQSKLGGILYLENDLVHGAFTPDRIEVLRLLSSQIAISIENAQLYTDLQCFSQNLEQLVEQRTQELSQTLENLKMTQSKLVESEKMAALGGLVAGIAHEINTPIGIGVTAASLLAEKTTAFLKTYQGGKMKRSELEKFLDTAIQSSSMVLSNLERAAELIQSFKQVAVDQSSEERRTFKIKAYLEEILLSLRPKLKKTNHTVAVYGDENLTLNSYPGALSQIVTNLIMNSLVHAYRLEDSGQICFSFYQTGERLMLEYADDGQGIDSENLSKIFDPFFTTKRGHGGSGLGLHIIYNLVTQRLQGSLHCESDIGRGTTFFIELPMKIFP